MDTITEIVSRLYAQIPFATVAVGILLLALAGMMLYSAVGHWRTTFQAQGQRSIDLTRWGIVVEWQRAGDPTDAWNWTAEEQDWLKSQTDRQKVVVGYRVLKIISMLVASLIGIAVMSGFALITLPYLGADFAKGTTLLLIVAPCVPAIYCGWFAWNAVVRIWRQYQGIPAYRLTNEFIEVGNSRYAWDNLKGIGRVMSASPSGEKLSMLRLWLPNKNTLDLDLGALDCRPEQLGIQVEWFWHDHQRAAAMHYAMALSRIAGFLIPLRAIRPVMWRVSPTDEYLFRYMAKTGSVDSMNASCVEFLVNDEPSGSMIGVCTYDDVFFEPQDRELLARRVDLTRIAHVLLFRVAHTLGTTYDRIGGPTIRTRETSAVTCLPTVTLRTEFEIAELALDGVDIAQTTPEGGFVFWLTLDAQLLAMLNREEKAHADERGEYPTYLEHEIVTAFDAFMSLQKRSS